MTVHVNHPVVNYPRLKSWVVDRFDPITERMDAAAGRRFPMSLQQAHVKRVEAGQITAATLAWMLDTDEADLGWERPPIELASVNDLVDALGL